MLPLAHSSLMPPVYQSIFSAGYRVMVRLLVSPAPTGTVPNSLCWVAAPAMPSTDRPFAFWNALTASATAVVYLLVTLPV